MPKQPKYPLTRPNTDVAAAQLPDPSASVPGPGVSSPKVKLNTRATRRVKSRNQRGPGCWVQGGTVEFFVAADWALTDLARERGIKTNPNTDEVEKLRSARVGEETGVYFYPTEGTDSDGVEIKRSTGKRKSKVTANFYDYLADEKLLIAVGKRERFDLVKVSDSESPVGPALKLDFAKPLETKLTSAKKRTSTKTKQSQAQAQDKAQPQDKAQVQDKASQAETKPGEGAEGTDK